jgi:hypothetical protein
LKTFPNTHARREVEAEICAGAERGRAKRIPRTERKRKHEAVTNALQDLVSILYTRSCIFMLDFILYNVIEFT